MLRISMEVKVYIYIFSIVCTGQLNLYNIIMKASRSDQVKQTHFYIDVINVQRLLARLL